MVLAIFVGIAAGACIVLSRNINSILAGKIGLLPGTFFNYLTGFLLSTAFFIFSNESAGLYFSLYEEVPIWAYMGGIVGIAVVAFSSIVTPKISAFYLTLIIFIGQLFTGIVVDYFVSDILSIGKFIGGLLVVAGLICNMIIDKKAPVL